MLATGLERAKKRDGFWPSLADRGLPGDRRRPRLSLSAGWYGEPGSRARARGKRATGRPVSGRRTSKRDRLRAELAAARAHSDASRSAAAGDAELAERATPPAARARRAAASDAEQRARHQAEVGRLEARVAELETAALKVHQAPPAAAPSVNGRLERRLEGAAPRSPVGTLGALDDLHTHQRHPAPGSRRPCMSSASITSTRSPGSRPRTSPGSIDACASRPHRARGLDRPGAPARGRKLAGAAERTRGAGRLAGPSGRAR